MSNPPHPEASAGEILPCPFCGSDPDVDGEDSTWMHLCRVRCVECGANRMRYWKTRAEAIADWNRRAPSAPVGGVEEQAVAPTRASVEAAIRLLKLSAYADGCFRKENGSEESRDAEAALLALYVPPVSATEGAHPDTERLKLMADDFHTDLNTLRATCDYARLHRESPPCDIPPEQGRRHGQGTDAL